MFPSFHPSSPPHIVLAEDDPTTARLIEIALNRTRFPHRLTIVPDGDEAVATIESTAVDLLLLDLYMPGKNGFEVLEYVKRHDRLRRVPVVMLSTSIEDCHVTRAYDLHVNAYVTKPTDFPDLCRSIDSIVQFWLGTALPAPNSPWIMR